MSAPTPANVAPSLKRTALFALHLAHDARMVPFAGYEMPVQYASGILKEHLHTRAAAGVFDVSHMGQIVVRAKSGVVDDAALQLESLIPVDILGLSVGRQRYGFFTNTTGGLLDDLMILRRRDDLMLIVNAACKDSDEAHLRAHISQYCIIERLDRSLIALQGPRAEDALAALAPQCRSMHFMDVRDLTLLGADCIVSRSGYSGEDGYEISIPNGRVEDIAAELLSQQTVHPIGLGARDSLRLEAGLCLYGSDISQTTTPVEAALGWAIQPVRRLGGARAGNFLGSDIILNELSRGAARARVGLIPEGRAPVRAGSALFADVNDTVAIGSVTSGGFGPCVDKPISMGYVPTELGQPGTRVFAELRGRRIAMTVVKLPFIGTRYKR